MNTENYYKGIKHVVHVRADTGMHCEHCDVKLDSEEIAESINHYIEQHGYKLLHIGTETCNDADGNLWHTTVAYLGNEKTLPKRSPPNIVGIQVNIASPQKNK